MNLILNIAAGLVNREWAIVVVRWGTLLILLHGTYLLVTSPFLETRALWFRALFGRKTMLSFIVVGAIGALITMGYWAGINRVSEALQGWLGCPKLNPRSQ